MHESWGGHDEAVTLYERALSLRIDLGPISEEHDPERKRLGGKLPQAFSLLILIETAFTLAKRQPPESPR